ncbi:MAG: hypothetical protein R6V14_08690 [Halanaerobiales bacterium]
MDNIFSYWPLLFLVLVVITRIVNYINKKNNVIKKSKADTSTDNYSNEDNLNAQNEKVDFEYDKDKFKQRYERENYNEDQAEEKKYSKKKLKVKKIKKKSKNKLFIKKNDIIRGIIMKEILDEPRFKKNHAKKNS